MKRVIISIVICVMVISVLTYYAINPLQSNITFVNTDKQDFTLVSFDIAKRSFVKLVLYDLSGKEVASFINEELDAGLHNVRINDERLSSGQYFYKLTTDNQLNIRKVTNFFRENGKRNEYTYDATEGIIKNLYLKNKW